MRRTFARPQVIDMNITLITDHLLMVLSKLATNILQKYRLEKSRSVFKTT